MKNEPINVKIITIKGVAMLVEWIIDAKVYRAIIPESVVTISIPGLEGFADLDILETGIPYGLPWKELIPKYEIMPIMLEEELHKAGIWTVEDFEKNPGDVQGAVAMATKRINRDLANIVKSHKK